MGDYASYQEPITVKKLPGSVQFNGGGGDLEATDRVNIQVLYPGDGSEIGVLSADDLIVNRDARIEGNLVVHGNTTTINTEHLIVTDPIIEMGSNAADGTTMGVVMQRPSGNVMMGYLSTENDDCYDNTLVFAYTSGSAYGSTLDVEPTNLPVYVNGTLDVSNNFSVGSNLCMGSNPVVTVNVSTGELNFDDDIKIRNVNPSNNSVAIGKDAGANNQGTNAIAIGSDIGTNDQNSYAIAIGAGSGYTSQGVTAIAIGANAGSSVQGASSIALGVNSGSNTQGASAISIGNFAGFQGQNAHSIAIGSGAGRNNQHANTVVINANGGVILDTGKSDALFVKPVRHAETTYGNLMSYDTTTGEITNSSNIRLDSLLPNCVVYTDADSTLSTLAPFSFDETTQIMEVDSTGGAVLRILQPGVFQTTTYKGQPIYISGVYSTGPNNGKLKFSISDNTDPLKMPAIGLAMETYTGTEVNGYVVRSGFINNTKSNGSHPIWVPGLTLNENDIVYVTGSGLLTNIRPTEATHLIQNIGIIMKITGGNVDVLVQGAGRANDIPNRIKAVDGWFSERLTVGKGDIDESANLYVDGTTYLDNSGGVALTVDSDIVMLGSNSNIAMIGTVSVSKPAGISFQEQIVGTFSESKIVFNGYDYTAFPFPPVENVYESMVIDGPKVGIGTSSPQYTLDVNGTMRIDGGNHIDWYDGSGTLLKRDSGSVDFVSVDRTIQLQGNNYTINGENGGDVRIGGTSGYIFYDYSSQNIGIGTTAPTSELEVNGVISATGSNLPLAPTSEGVHIGKFADDGAGIELISNTSTWGLIDFVNTTPGSLNWNQRISGGRSGGNLDFWTGTNSGGDVRMSIDSTGNVGINTSTPINLLHIRKDTSSQNTQNSLVYDGTLHCGPPNLHGAGFHLEGDCIDSGRFDETTSTIDFTGWAIGQEFALNNGADMYFKTRRQDGSLTEKMRITDSGFVGINKTDPSWPLDVEGVVQVTSDNFDTRGLLYTTTQPCLNIESSNIFDNNDKRPVCLNAFGGNVGIGLTNPNRKLFVNGDAYASSNIGTPYIGLPAATAGAARGSIAFATSGGVGNATICSVLPARNVSTLADGTTNLGRSDYRWNTVYATTGTINTSDENEKKDVTGFIHNEKAAALEIAGMFKTYKFKGGTRTHVGIMAQHIAEVFDRKQLDATNYGMFCTDNVYYHREITNTNIDSVRSVDDNRGLSDLANDGVLFKSDNGSYYAKEGIHRVAEKTTYAVNTAGDTDLDKFVKNGVLIERNNKYYRRKNTIDVDVDEVEVRSVTTISQYVYNYTELKDGYDSDGYLNSTMEEIELTENLLSGQYGIIKRVVYGVRYDELLCFVVGAMKADFDTRLTDFEGRLASVEASIGSGGTPPGAGSADDGTGGV